MAHGRGYGTSGKKKKAGTGTRAGERLNKGPGMDEIVKGELPASPEAEIEARRSDRPDAELPPDAAAIRRRGRKS